MPLAAEVLCDELKARDIDFYAGVPDSLLKAFCFHVSEVCGPQRHVITANEGGAVALVAGYYLASGRLGVAYMQNSGLGNAVNPLTSLTDAKVYGIPALLLIGWRGEPNTKDEPQHMRMGEIMPNLLEVLGIPYKVLPNTNEELAPLLDACIHTAKSQQTPVALVARAKTFTESSRHMAEGTNDYTLPREEALSIIIDKIERNCPVVCTTGMASRELFELRAASGQTHDADFLTVGSMGHCSQIALGIAMGQDARRVYCIDGDGAALMHLGGLTTIGSLAPAGLQHIVLNNGAHDSVGGQPTVAYQIDLCDIGKACGYRRVFRAQSASELASALDSMRHAQGPVLLEVRVAKGARADLGRPTRSPAQSKDSFMRFMKG